MKHYNWASFQISDQHMKDAEEVEDGKNVHDIQPRTFGLCRKEDIAQGSGSGTNKLSK